jgi:hypothetical protein
VFSAKGAEFNFEPGAAPLGFENASASAEGAIHLAPSEKVNGSRFQRFLPRTLNSKGVAQG